MDDMNGFERQVAGEVVRAMGPIRPVDDLAIFNAVSSGAPARWTVRPLFSAARLVVAGAIVALFGGFLLAAVLTRQPGVSMPAAVPSASSSPQVDASATTGMPDPSETTTVADLLPGVELRVEAVEPAVRRVVDDGVRDLDWEASWSPAEAELVVSGGDVWVVRDEAIRVGAAGSRATDVVGDPPFKVAVNGDGSIALVAAGYDVPSTWSPQPSNGTDDSPLIRRATPASSPEDDIYGRFVTVGPNLVVWQRAGETLQRHTPSGTEVFGSDDDIPVFEGNSPLVKRRTVVSPDGSVWFSLHAAGKTGSDCGGVVHYDGRASSYFLQGRGFCVSAMDVDAAGRLWVLGSSSHFGTQQAGDGRDRLYVIDASGTNLDGQGRENEMDQRMSPRATAVAAMSLATALATATVPAVTAQDLQPTMSEFTGRLGCGAPGPSSEAVSWQFPVQVISDERLDGNYVNQLAGYEDGDPDVDGIGAYSALWEITNDAGGWVGQTASFRFPPDSYSTFSVKLDGQGAYEGLTAVMEADFTEACGFDIRGVVIDGELPATPVAVVTVE